MKISNLVKKILPQSAFVRGVSVLVGGTAGAQALMVLASPLLTRLYTPEDFGLLAVYGGLLALFTVVASLRYELAIPLPECNAEAANVLILSLLVVCVMATVCGLMVFFIGEEIAIALGAPQLAKFFWLLPIGVFLSGIYNVFNYWAIRTKTFGDIAKTQITQTLTTLSIQLLGYKFGGIALMFGQAGGQGMGSVRLARSAFKHPEFNSWSWLGIWQAAKRYKQFPIFSTWAAMFNTAGTQLPPLMFAALFSAGAAGLYALANRILQLPMSVLGSAIGQVLFSGLAEARQDGTMAKKIEHGSVTLLSLSLPAASVFMIFAPDLFGWIFGENWRSSGDVARWMVPWIIFQFISSPLSVVYFVLEREKIGLYFQFFMFLFRGISILVGFVFFDFINTLIIFSSVSAFCYFSYCISIFLIADASPLFFIKGVVFNFLKIAICLLPIVFILEWSLLLALIFSMLVLFILYWSSVREIIQSKKLV